MGPVGAVIKGQGCIFSFLFDFNGHEFAFDIVRKKVSLIYFLVADMRRYSSPCWSVHDKKLKNFISILGKTEEEKRETNPCFDERKKKTFCGAQ